MARSSKGICPKTPGWAAARWGLYLTHRACDPACWLKSCGSHTTGKYEEEACVCATQEGAARQLRGWGGLWGSACEGWGCLYVSSVLLDSKLHGEMVHTKHVFYTVSQGT